MKVHELIEILSNKDPNDDVCMRFHDDEKEYELCKIGDPDTETGFHMYTSPPLTGGDKDEKTQCNDK